MWVGGSNSIVQPVLYNQIHSWNVTTLCRNVVSEEKRGWDCVVKAVKVLSRSSGGYLP